MNIYYVEDNCFAWTFEAKKVKKIVEDECLGKVLNLFAGKYRLDIPETRVDISPEFCPDVVMDAEDFIKTTQLRFDTIIYDPPWNERKSKEFYNGHQIGKFTKLKTAITLLLNTHGKIISIGYEITNFGKSRNMMLETVYVVNPKGEIRPYFISIERQINSQLELKRGGAR